MARLLALTHDFDAMLAAGEIADYAALARLAGVSRPRMTQIMNLLHLAPDIQEALLELRASAAGRDEVTEREVRAISAEPSWTKQRILWRTKALCAGNSGCRPFAGSVIRPEAEEAGPPRP